ncbi:hypothetical protein [Variovorax sp. J22R115]|uniref:hypothetical protein n=1 Tax=Variovorax sp. J22R115 TaxID=3053509 RepID=UPI0025765F69|nr:hypothetical protein [Variovorax sp. J22R115]MDM0048810.1 hypothetical protein [Variovorax sp. J22R115]
MPNRGGPAAGSGRHCDRGLYREARIEGLAPAWFASVEYVEWSGATKDLTFIPGIEAAQQALLVDDYASYVHPGQEGQWVSVAQFESPYSQSDQGLASALAVLQQRLE